MKSSNATPPGNTPSDHPPLAHDAQGHPIEMPEGSAFWMLKRQTNGRPKTIFGPDRRALRLPLDTTEDEIAETYGPGTYRLDALDALGNPIDHVTTLVIGDDDERDDSDGESRAWPGPRRSDSELRFALETIAHMTRAQSSALQAVAEAQADWVKGLASARLIPRNAVYLPPGAQAQLPAPVDETDDDDDDDTDDVAEAPALPAYAVVAQAAQGIVQGFPAAMQSFMQTVASIAAMRNAKAVPATPASTPAANAPNPMVHLSEINERLTGPERRFLRQVLRSKNADVVTRELLARSVDDAVAFLKDAIATAQAERPAPNPTANVDVPTSGGDLTSRVAAVAMLLSPEEQSAVMTIVLRLSPARLAQLQDQLLAMTVEDAVAWIRENLASLKAEVGA